MENAIFLEEKNEENDRVGFLTSVAVHLLLLLLCLLPFFNYPDPPPQESGIMVSFGEPDAGSQAERQSTKSVQEVSENKPKPKETKPVEKETKPKESSPPAKKEVMTNDIVQEESPVNVVKDDGPSKAELEAARKQAAAEAKAKAEAKAEAARAAKEAEYKESKASFGDLFSSGRGNNGNSGDQGDPNGSPDSDILDGISNGNSMIGGGLSTRALLYEPSINDNSQKTGRVVVKVCVNPTGKVTEAEFTQKGSTTTDNFLVNKAIQTARKYKFNPAEQSLQCGTITFDFKLI